MHNTIKHGYYDFILNHICPNVYVVGTLKQGIGTYGSGFKTFIHGDNFRYEEVYRQFVCRLSKRIYGKTNYKRWGKNIPNAGTLEGGNHMRFHLNILLQRPDFINESEFEIVIQEEWAKLQWAMPDINIQTCGSGCIYYVLKEGEDRVFFA